MQLEKLYTSDKATALLVSIRRYLLRYFIKMSLYCMYIIPESNHKHIHKYTSCAHIICTKIRVIPRYFTTLEIGN